jgi:hypothetical protein
LGIHREITVEHKKKSSLRILADRNYNTLNNVLYKHDGGKYMYCSSYPYEFSKI